MKFTKEQLEKIISEAPEGAVYYQCVTGLYYTEQYSNIGFTGVNIMPRYHYGSCILICDLAEQLQEMKMKELIKEITVENFNYTNAKRWIGGFSHKEKVQIAVYSAELAIDLYDGASDAPKLAIQAAKDWLLNPTEENKDKCLNAADAAADAANAAANAAYTDAEIKAKIVDFILSIVDKENEVAVQESNQAEIDNTAQQVGGLAKESERDIEKAIELKNGDECEFEYPDGVWNLGYFHGKTKRCNMNILEYKNGGIEMLGGLTNIRNQLTPEQKQQKIDEQNGELLFDIFEQIDFDMRNEPKSIWDNTTDEWKSLMIEVAKQIDFEGKLESI